MINIDEKTLIQSAINGSATAFEALLKEYEAPVYNLCLRMLGNEEDAADATQDSFIKVWKCLDSFHAESQFSTWLYRLASNTCLDKLRKRKRTNEVSLTVEDDNEDIQELNLPDPALNPEDAYIQAEQKAVVMKALNALETEQKEIIILRVINDLSYSEIAEIMGIAEGTVKSRLSRARDNLRKKLQKDWNIFPRITSKTQKGGQNDDM